MERLRFVYALIFLVLIQQFTQQLCRDLNQPIVLDEIKPRKQKDDDVSDEVVIKDLTATKLKEKTFGKKETLTEELIKQKVESLDAPKVLSPD